MDVNPRNKKETQTARGTVQKGAFSNYTFCQNTRPATKRAGCNGRACHKRTVRGSHTKTATVFRWLFLIDEAYFLSRT